jgi:hypothetical protein
MTPAHLVLIPGHAVWSGRGDPLDSGTWFLKPFQNNEPALLIEHLRSGIAKAAEDTASVLVLTGGPTERQAGPRSEALGYWEIAERNGFWGHTGVRERCVLEEYSLDSFLNLMYGLCRCREWAGGWPARITVAGWGFKSRRFAELHRRALRWERPFESLAVNEPPGYEEAAAREAETREQWRLDPYGALAPLAGKRASRDHFRRTPPYASTCPEVAGLLAHRGPEVYTGALPWDAGGL